MRQNMIREKLNQDISSLGKNLNIDNLSVEKLFSGFF